MHHQVSDALLELRAPLVRQLPLPQISQITEPAPRLEYKVKILSKVR